LFVSAFCPMKKVEATLTAVHGGSDYEHGAF